MSNGNDKFNMFDNHQEQVFQDDELVEIVSITAKSDTRKKYSASVVSRSQEEYETFIESEYFETAIHPETKEEYQVKVTVLKPEQNPLEFMKPAYAYSSSH